jgi:hypothetical protein
MSASTKVILQRLKSNSRGIFYILTWILLQPLSGQALPMPSQAPLELELLQPNAATARGDVVTADTISQTGLTLPSLWWAKEQFAGKLLNNWLAYPQEKRVDLVVNRQLWTLLDYIDRYSFVNEFGTVARDYGYNVRVFNQQKKLLAAYTCSSTPAQPDCDIWVETSGQDSLRVRPQI